MKDGKTPLTEKQLEQVNGGVQISKPGKLGWSSFAACEKCKGQDFKILEVHDARLVIQCKKCGNVTNTYIND
ncbi:hypothetical protein [Christensenella tenuis]|uniref:Uncharacterized protein n=1 Tax=Christensenella tenuis TaxID=2763033 RepID=A0ABR7EHY8_9FIRM|nr:hypothetical protein [Christensenella tenuis]MBC5649390.1 hypothetical protein [Christensenella tenuis]